MFNSRHQRKYNNNVDNIQYVSIKVIYYFVWLFDQSDYKINNLKH